MKLSRLTLIMAISALLASCAAASTETKVDVEGDLGYCTRQIGRSLSQLSADSTDYTMMPRNIAMTDSVWHCRKATPDEWCSGFWPGILWYAYEATGGTVMREQAEKYTASLEYLSKAPAFDHDLGFHPAGSEIDASIIYADYYYIEALMRMKKLNEEGKGLLAFIR